MTKRSAIHFLMWSLPLGGFLFSPARAADLAPRAIVTPAVEAAPSPFDLNATYIGEAWKSNGGLKTGTDYMSGLDVSLGVDLDKLLGLHDAKFYVEGFYVAGKSLDQTYTGAIQAPSSLDAFVAMERPKLYQAYYEQTFGSTNVLIGKYDLQTQFATTRPMDVFANRGQSMPLTFLVVGTASGFNNSVYPDTTVGLRIKQQLNEQLSVKVGLLNGKSDLSNGASGLHIDDKYGALGVGEVDYTPSKYTKLMAGLWGSSGKFNKLGQFSGPGMPVQTRGELGEYVGGATRLYTIEGARGVDGFANVGFAPERTNVISKSFDGGVTITGPFAARPHDKLGVSVAVGQNSQGYKALQLLRGIHLAAYETNYEFTYRAKVTDWLVLQPEIEYIVHPSYGGQASGAPFKNAFVFGLHFEIHNEWN